MKVYGCRMQTAAPKRFQYRRFWVGGVSRQNQGISGKTPIAGGTRRGVERGSKRAYGF